MRVTGSLSTRRTAGRLAAASVAVGTLLTTAGVTAAGAVLTAPQPSAAATTVPMLPCEVDFAALEAEAAAKAAAAAAEEAAHKAREAAAAEARRPKALAPTAGILTSNFGPRWGEFHGGVDIAAMIGTPIVAVTDGVVLEAGPASGFGLWVRVQQDDGTIGIFGHVNEFFVKPGQHVRAGDVIATVGNRGQSSGPHLHYEVWRGADQKTDPVAWLAARGIGIGPAQH